MARGSALALSQSQRPRSHAHGIAVVVITIGRARFVTCIDNACALDPVVDIQ